MKPQSKIFYCISDNNFFFFLFTGRSYLSIYQGIDLIGLRPYSVCFANSNESLSHKKLDAIGHCRSPSNWHRFSQQTFSTKCSCLRPDLNSCKNKILNTYVTEIFRLLNWILIFAILAHTIKIFPHFHSVEWGAVVKGKIPRAQKYFLTEELITWTKKVDLIFFNNGYCAAAAVTMSKDSLA